MFQGNLDLISYLTPAAIEIRACGEKTISVSSGADEGEESGAAPETEDDESGNSSYSPAAARTLLAKADVFAAARERLAF